MTKVRDILIREPGNYELPLVMVDVNSGRTHRLESVNKFLSGHFDQGHDLDYICGSVQLDLTGDESFVLIFYKFPDITC